MKSSYIHLVVNPTAGSGKAKRVAQTLLQKIRQISDSEFVITFTKQKNDAIGIAGKAIADGASMIVAVGGDGTINEVINGFYLDGNLLNTDCELGIINCGTGGGYASTLYGSKSLEQQIELLFQPGSSKLDLGRVSCKDINGNSIYRLFSNECQTGIGSKVVAKVGRISKIFGGKIAFGFTATFQGIVLKPQFLNISYDDEPYQECRLLGLVVGNGPECGGGMKLTPDANLTDGLFDVLSIYDMNIAQRLLNLSKVYSGKHILSSHFSIRRCKKLKIRSDIEIAIEADGELLGFSPFDIEIIPAAISVKTNYTRMK